MFEKIIKYAGYNSLHNVPQKQNRFLKLLNIHISNHTLKLKSLKRHLMIARIRFFKL